MKLLNLAGYRFVRLQDLAEIRQRLLEKGRELDLRGTILIAEEGINAFFAGTPESAEAFVSFLNDIPEFFQMEFRRSESKANPFKRFLVRLKKEIVTMRSSEVDPLHEPAPLISPRELKELYASGKDFIILDARKDFEYRMGHFKGAINLKLDHFSTFPQVLEEFPEEWRKKPVITYCTGGIRCEKAAPLMLKRGFSNVRQLEGGILNYLEQCGGQFYEGNCFVFDHRVLLNCDLEVVTELRCRSCHVPIEREEERLMEPGLLQLCDLCRIENPSCAVQ